MKKLYAGSYGALRASASDWRPAAILAVSIESARSRGRLIAEEIYPASQGYYSHFCDFVEVPQHMIAQVGDEVHA